MDRLEGICIAAARPRGLSLARLRLPFPSIGSSDIAGEFAAGRRARPPAHRQEREDLEKDLAHVEGLFLRERAFRFADFTESRLYSADLMEADLRGAFLKDAQLQGAGFLEARLQGADFWRADLQGADLRAAQLQGANLQQAGLQSANLAAAYLWKAILWGAQLQGAYLDWADLWNATLWGAQLQGASLADARLWDADLSGTQLQGANLQPLSAESINYAPLLGANLSGAQMQGGNLRTLQLWQPAITTWTNLGLADLRSASWKPPNENEMARLANIVDALPVGERWQRDSKARLKRLITAGTQSDESPDFALDGLLLVDDVDDPRWQRLDRSRLTTDVHTYDEALLPFLADLARSDPYVARGVASRVGRPWILGQMTEDNREALLEQRDRAARLARGLLDRAGPALPDDVQERLSRIATEPVAKD